MTTKRAKELLGELIMGLSDEEIQEFIIQCKRISSIILDFAQEEAKK